jgi:hypothetical protein
MNPNPGPRQTLENLFGPLDPNEADEVLADLQQRNASLSEEEPTHLLLARAAAQAPRPLHAPPPPMPDHTLLRLEGIRHLGAQAVAPERLAPEPPPQRHDSGWSAMLTLALGALAAVAVVAMFAQRNHPATAPSSGPAIAARVLTPGGETGFTRPTLTWELKDPVPVRAEIVEAGTGNVVASAGPAFSPLTFERMSPTDLVPGRAYEVRLVSPDRVPVHSKGFKVATDARGAPVREPSLDGVIRQCEDFINRNRPGDAWMLWAELTETEKSDPRMQALKRRILELAG